MRSALAILFSSACAATLGGQSADVLISLERYACFGTCPVYTLTIHDDGRFEYHGARFVKLEGDISGFLTLGQVKRLERAFADAGYFTLADRYIEERLTDMPTAITSYRQGNRVKSVEHYYGDDHVPAALGKLEDQIDDIVGTDRWIGTPKEREVLSRQWW